MRRIISPMKVKTPPNPDIMFPNQTFIIASTSFFLIGLLCFTDYCSRKGLHVALPMGIAMFMPRT